MRRLARSLPVLASILLAGAAGGQQARTLDRQLWVMAAGSNQLYVVGPGDRTVRYVGGPSPGSGFNSLALAPDRHLYAVSQVTETLHRFDPRTGASTLVGSLGVSVGQGGLAIGSDGSAWVTGYQNVHSIDLATGAVTGNAGAGVLQPLAMDLRSDGKLVVLENRRGTWLFELDLSVPSAVSFALLPVAVGNQAGLAIDGPDGYLATGGTATGGTHELWGFDPFTGEAWFLRELPEVFRALGSEGIALLPRHPRTARSPFGMRPGGAR